MTKKLWAVFFTVIILIGLLVWSLLRAAFFAGLASAYKAENSSLKEENNRRIYYDGKLSNARSGK